MLHSEHEYVLITTFHFWLYHPYKNYHKTLMLLDGNAIHSIYIVFQSTSKNTIVHVQKHSITVVSCPKSAVTHYDISVLF